MFTVRVEKISEFEVRTEGEYLNINSSTGDVILIAKGNNEILLCKFSLHQDGPYSNEWRRQCPMNKQWIYVCLTDTGDVMMQDQNYHTYLFDQDMQLIDSWQHTGDLIACLPGPRTVYEVEKEQHFFIDIRNQDGEILRLKSEGRTKEYPYPRLSVCEDVTTGRLVVLYTTKQGVLGDRFIDIFSQYGKSRCIVIHLLFRIYSTDETVLAY